MDAALGWCCCLEAIEGEREPVPWKSVFYGKETQKKYVSNNNGTVISDWGFFHG